MVETKQAGTALLIMNRREDEFTFEPLKIVLETASGNHAPCTVHLLNLQGIGVPTTVAVKPRSTEGLLGACPDHDDNKQFGSRLVIREPITKVTVGGAAVRMLQPAIEKMGDYLLTAVMFKPSG